MQFDSLADATATRSFKARFSRSNEQETAVAVCSIYASLRQLEQKPSESKQDGVKGRVKLGSLLCQVSVYTGAWHNIRKKGGRKQPPLPILMHTSKGQNATLLSLSFAKFEEVTHLLLCKTLPIAIS